MLAGFLPTSVPIPRPTPPNRNALSWARSVAGPTPFGARPLVAAAPRPPARSVVRMGGGPRTFPGGVSKWQWKRMQAKKAKQLLKARLCRERQLYEMRKRSELKAAVSALERPWEVVERAPNLFSASADDQLKALADRFQRPGGFDMWSDRDGPQVFRSPDALPSARFFPKGAVHSVRPYGVVPPDGENGSDDEDDDKGELKLKFDDWIARGAGWGTSRRLRRTSSTRAIGVRSESSAAEPSDLIDEGTEFADHVRSNSRDSGYPKRSSHKSSNASNSRDSGFPKHSGRKSNNASTLRDFGEEREQLKFGDCIARGGGGTSGRSRRSSSTRPVGGPWESSSVEPSDLNDGTTEFAEHIRSNSRDSGYRKHSSRESSNASNLRDSRFLKHSGREARNPSNSRHSGFLKHSGREASIAVEDQRLSRKGVARSKRGGNSNRTVRGFENGFRWNSLANSAGEEESGTATGRRMQGGSTH